ncbi:MAG: DUF4294 domain-containing protein [Chitinophagaceae bacterium]|jgi:hypothetical protein|nr:MAG: DUF4294 domain-containing protein [Chitinophagaceae bacterium]
MLRLIILYAVILSAITAKGEDKPTEVKNFDPSKSYEIVETDTFNGEQMPTVNLNEVQVATLRHGDAMATHHYNRLRRNLMIVYPYAKLAAQLLDEIDNEVEQFTRRRHQRRYMREKQQELRDSFEAELKELTVTQGKLLVKLINRETGDDCYRLIRELRNPIQAVFWQSFARFHGYDLKEPYIAEENQDIERILKQLEESNFPTEISKR